MQKAAWRNWPPNLNFKFIAIISTNHNSVIFSLFLKNGRERILNMEKEAEKSVLFQTEAALWSCRGLKNLSLKPSQLYD